MKRKKRSTFPAGSWVHAWVVLRSPEAEPSLAERSRPHYDLDAMIAPRPRAGRGLRRGRVAGRRRGGVVISRGVVTVGAITGGLVTVGVVTAGGGGGRGQVAWRARLRDICEMVGSVTDRPSAFHP